MPNPFSIDPVNPLAALMAGQQGYDTAQKNYKQNQIEDARKAVAAGNLDPKTALATLIGAGDVQGAQLYGQQAQQALMAAHQKATEGFEGRRLGIAEQQANEPKYMPSTDENGNPIVLELKAGRQPVVVRPSEVPTGHTGVPGPSAPVATPYQQSGLTPENSGSMVGRPGERILADASFNERFAGAAPQLAPQQPASAVSAPGVLPPAPKFPQGINQPEARKAYSHELGKAQANRPQAEQHVTESIANYDRLIAEAKAIRDDPNLKRITGLYGAAPNIPGSGASDLTARLETLKSETGLSALQSLRDASKTGGALGQITEGEHKILQNNVTALDRKQSEPAFKKSMDRLISFAEGSKQRLTAGFEKTYGSSHPGANPMPAASGAQRAPDGNWYLPDPNRPGKYLQIVP